MNNCAGRLRAYGDIYDQCCATMSTTNGETRRGATEMMINDLHRMVADADVGSPESLLYSDG